VAINDLIRDVAAARETVAALGNLASGAEVRASLLQARRRLDSAIAETGELQQALFVLQEQNQQLRKDLTQRVCPKLCAHGRGCAS